MFSVLRFTLYFVLSFAILSIPFNNKLLFVHIYEKVAPQTNALYNDVKDSTKRVVRRGVRVSKKFFDNSSPVVIDTVKSGISSGIEKTQAGLESLKPETSNDTTNEQYTQEEQRFLKKVLTEEEGSDSEE